MLTSQNEEFRRKIESLESQAKKDREYISILESKVEDLQRTSRKASVELKNVPKKPQESREDLLNIVTCLSRSKKYKYCWSSYGNFFVRKDDSSKIILIQNDAQITQLQQEK